MELRQLSYFVAVAEELHFGRAASKVGIAQPSLTQQIQRLERELDVTLLRRNSHAVGLTAAGELFLREAQATIRQADDATAMVRPREVGGRQVFPAGTVRIGYVRPAAIRVLPETLRQLLRSQPRARVKLAEMWTGEQFQALASGELDVGFVFGPVSHPGLESVVLSRETFAVLIPAAFRLAHAPRVDFADLASEPMVWFRRELSPSIFDQFSLAAADTGSMLNISYEAEHARVIRLLVAAGQALGVVTGVCAAAVRDPDVVPRRFTGGPAGEDLSLVWRADEQHPLVIAFTGIVRQIAGMPAMPAAALSSRIGPPGLDQGLAVELRQLTYFVVAAEELNLSRAAERMHITQPAFSQQIRRLERRLGVRLLHVTSHRIKLTPAGEAFLHEAQRTLAQAEAAAETARRAGRGELGTVTIAFTEAAARLLPAMLRSARERYPDVTPTLYEMWSGDQLDALRNQRIDVGFVYGRVADPQLRSRVAYTEEFVAVLPQSHPLAETTQVQFREFLAEPQVIFRRELNPALHDHLAALSRSVGRQMRVIQEVDHAASIPILVAAGVGVAVTSKSRWSQFDGQPGVVSRAIIEPTPSAEARMVWHSDNQSAVLANFLETADRLAPAAAGASRRGEVS
jgi:DNA-binding transcriptional LysR family regulator